LRTRYAALLSLGALAVGGPMFVLGLPSSFGLLARAGAVLLSLGTAAALASLLHVQRANHHLLRRQASQLRAVAEAASASPKPSVMAELDGRLAQEREALIGTITASHREVIRTVDARILGLWEGLLERRRDEGP
jgi:hypothetical protein